MLVDQFWCSVAKLLEEYNGTSWTAGGANLNLQKDITAAATGTQTAALATGGRIGLVQI